MIETLKNYHSNSEQPVLKKMSIYINNHFHECDTLMYRKYIECDKERLFLLFCYLFCTQFMSQSSL